MPTSTKEAQASAEGAGWVKRNGMSLTMFALFVLSLIGQIISGHASYNAEEVQHGQAAIPLLEYLTSGHFVEAVFENWESEFLQMAAFVFFSSCLYQQGSPDSRKLEGEPELDADPEKMKTNKSPWPVKRGGIVLKVYEHSLTLGLLLLFFLSFLLHAHGGARAFSAEELEHGGKAVSMFEFMASSQFWFESMQNWQSEFFSVGALSVLSIFLRQRRSPQSKPVAAPHSQTGDA